MMKKIMSLCALVCVLAFSASCKKDSPENSDWKEIPSEIITAESGNAVITVNAVPVQVGNAKLSATSGNVATLTLNNIIPGYNKVEMDVDLKSAGKGEWTFSGNTSLVASPSMISLFSTTARPAIYEITSEGRITSEGKITITASSRVSDVAQAGLAGTWNLLRTVAPGSNMLPSAYPIQVTWTAGGNYAASAANLSMALSLLGSVNVADSFNSMTFHEDGNITAEYWESDSDDEGGFQMPDVQTLLKALIGPDGKYHFNATSHTEWLSLPKANLAFWYAQDYFYMVPNVAALAGDDENADFMTRANLPSGDSSLSDILDLLNDLKELGVDVKALMPQIQQIMKSGFRFKYSQENGALELYADKEMCDPIINAFLPALPKLDELLAGMADNPDISAEEKAQLAAIMQLMKAFGLEKPSDFVPLWQNTQTFRISINLVKA